MNACVAVGYLAGTPWGVLSPRELVLSAGVLAVAASGYGLVRARRLTDG